jgi:hypothetical protein
VEKSLLSQIADKIGDVVPGVLAEEVTVANTTYNYP